MMGVKLHRLRQEVEKYRSELGCLTIDDSEKAYALGRADARSRCLLLADLSARPIRSIDFA